VRKTAVMLAYAAADKIAFTCCLILAVLTAAAYARWHYWWRTGFGRSRMALLAAFAGLTLERAVRGWATLPGTGTQIHVLDWIRLSSAFLAAFSLLWLLCGIISLNIRRVREPGFAADRGRQHLERTPWASQAEIEKLTAAWDEMHGSPRL